MSILQYRKPLPDVNIVEYSEDYRDFIEKIWRKGDDLRHVMTPNKITVTKTVFLDESVDFTNKKEYAEYKIIEGDTTYTLYYKV